MSIPAHWTLEDGFRKIFGTILDENRSSAYGIQIGAFDGNSFDETQPILKDLKFPFLFVEPIPYYFERMKKALNYHQNNRFDNCAISDTDGTAQMVVYDPSRFYENKPMSKEFCLTGMSSLYPVRNNPWEAPTHQIEVTTKTMATLLKDNWVDSIDVFLCDTEGYDYQIFKQIHPDDALFWRFEIQHLPEHETAEMIDAFRSSGFSIFAYHDAYPVYTDTWPAYQEHRCHDLTAINTALLERLS